MVAPALNHDRVEEVDADTLSPSQVDCWKACERQGAFKYIERLPDPGSKSTERGKRIHTLLEEWLTKGIAPGSNAAVWDDVPEAQQALEIKAALAAISKLPAPMSEGMRVEGGFTFLTHGVKFRGFKDLTYWTAGEPSKLIVHDHKTTSNFKWAKTREDLRHDTQAVLYAQESFQKYPALEELELNWLYITTDAHPRTHKVALTVYRDAVDAETQKIATFGKRIVALKMAGRPANDHAPAVDPETCRRFGGCPYLSVCGITPIQRIQAAFRYDKIKHNPALADSTEKNGESKMTQKPLSPAEITARISANAARRAAQAPIVPQAPAESAPVAGPPVESIRARLAAPPPSPGFTGVVPPPRAETAKVDFAESPPVVDEPTGTYTAEQIQAVRQTAPANEDVVVPAGNNPAPTRGRGRPRKTPVEALGLDKAMTTAAPTATPTSQDAMSSNPFTSTDAMVTKTPSAEGFTLYVNCAPVRPSNSLNRIVLLSTFMAEVHALIEAEMGYQHYTFAEFGKGRGILLTAIKQHLAVQPLGAHVALIVDARTAEGADALPALEQAAGSIIRGF